MGFSAIVEKKIDFLAAIHMHNVVSTLNLSYAFKECDFWQFAFGLTIIT